MVDKHITEYRTTTRERKLQRLREKFFKYSNDPNIKERREEQICKSCFYMDSDVIRGEAFTTNACESCGAGLTFATTDIDCFCKECAVTNHICKHCGATMD